jgi:hypothetical protein
MALLDITPANGATSIVELSRGTSGTLDDIVIKAELVPPHAIVELARGNTGVLIDINRDESNSDVELVLRTAGYTGMNRGLS